MAEIQTVRARERQGARSLDLTIPVAVIDEFNVATGDVFAISIDGKGDELTLRYRRVYTKNE
jgi:hypothetical protein